MHADLIARLQNVPIIPNSLALWGLGQMGLILQGPGAVLYIDPYLSDVVRERAGPFWQRAYPPPIAPEMVTNAAYYLISHEHLDHLDTATTEKVAKTSPQVKFIAPAWCNEILLSLGIDSARIINPPTLQAVTLQDNLTLTAVPAAHYALEHTPEKGHRWIGFHIQWNGVTLYHAGDTIIYPGYLDTLQKLPKPDLAMIPVNGRDYYRDVRDIVGNLMPAEAARLAQDMEWDVTLIGHNDLFPNNTIPMANIAAAFEQIAPRRSYKFLQPGELYYYVKT